MTEDAAKDEALRLCSPMYMVCQVLAAWLENPTGVVLEPGRHLDFSRGLGRCTMFGSVQFTIRVLGGHAPVRRVRNTFLKIGEVPFGKLCGLEWQGMEQLRSEHKSLRDTTIVYSAEFTWICKEHNQ